MTVYNYWEPLHFLIKGYGFQTWEYAPEFAIRSWTYLLLHTIPVNLVNLVSRHDKVSSPAMPSPNSADKYAVDRFLFCSTHFRFSFRVH